MTTEFSVLSSPYVIIIGCASTPSGDGNEKAHLIWSGAVELGAVRWLDWVHDALIATVVVHCGGGSGSGIRV